MKLLNKIHYVQRQVGYLIFTLALTALLTSCSNQALNNGTSDSNANPNKGIVNGSRIIKRNAGFFASVLRLEIDGEALCTGTYLGNGFVLTAYHCVGLTHTLKDKDKPTIRLSSTAGLQTTRASKTSELEIFVAPTEKEVQAGEFKVPMPDIVILKFLGEFALELEGVPSAIIGKAPLAIDETETYIAGYGNDQFDTAVSSFGLLNLGLAKIVKVDDILVTSFYLEGDKFAAVLPGDSGGPLFKLEEKKLVVYGVASTVLFDDKQVEFEGTSSGAASHHSRTDTKELREWIDCMLSQTF